MRSSVAECMLAKQIANATNNPETVEELTNMAREMIEDPRDDNEYEDESLDEFDDDEDDLDEDDEDYDELDDLDDEDLDDEDFDDDDRYLEEDEDD